MLSSGDLALHRAALRTPTLARAHESLRTFFGEPDYDLNALTGAPTGVAVWDRNGYYLFSWHIAAQHLLFYIRRPALNAAPHLHALAVRHHGPDSISINAKEETTIRLRSHEEACTLLDWLRPELPLQATGRRGRRRST